MNDLMIHTGALRVSRDSVVSVATPPSTETHFPIPHADLLTRVEQLVDGHGWTVRRSAHALSHNDNRYFGLIELAGSGDDHGTVIGIRNSHDKTFPAALALGASVFVCDNLSFAGDVRINRKHTRHIMADLPRLVAQAFGRLSDFRQGQADRFASYKNSGLLDREAHDLMIRAIDARAISASKLPAVIKEWRSPSHPEFSDRNVWSLFNAFTEVYKTGSLVQTHQRSQRLHGLLDNHLGIAT